MCTEKTHLPSGLDKCLQADARRERRNTTRLRAVAVLSLLLALVHYWHSFTRTLPYSPTSRCATDGLRATDHFDWNAHPPSKALNWTGCYSQVGHFQCARLSVPLLYSDPGSGEAAVALIKYPSKYPAGHEKYRGAVFFNPGGPGGPGTEDLTSNGRAKTLQTILTDEFDVISFDPRGVGYTTPGLNTFNDQVEAGKFYLQLPDNVNATESSFGEAYAWSEILSGLVADRMQFVAERMSTPLVARDMLSIVEALGQDKLQYWGISYGSVLGATFAAMFPDKVGRIVIDGVDDAENYYKALWSNNLRDTDAALMDIYTACINAGPSRCPIYEENASLIKARVDRLLDRLKSEPVAFLNSTSPEAYDVVDYALAKNVIFETLYDTHSDGADLTKAIVALEHGDSSLFYAMSNRRKFDSLLQCAFSGGPVPPPNRIFDAVAAIACGDNVEDRQEEIGEVRDAYEEMTRVSSFADNWTVRMFCSVWKVRGKERFNGSFEHPIATSHPLLLIGNTADPVTPLVNAHKMSGAFEDSVVLTQSSSGHCSFSATSLCTSKVVRAYFVNGTLPEEGTVCEVDSSIFEEKRVDLEALSAEDRVLIDVVEALRKA